MIKKFFILFSLIFFSLVFNHQLQASEEFKIESKINYQASTQELMRVNHQVSLTNKLSNVYAQQYTFSIEGRELNDIYAWDEEGEIKYQAQIEPNLVSITLPFNQEVVGKDETLKFGLNYTKADLIKKSGDIWEIVIPRFSGAEAIDSLSITLKVPLNFGQVAFISPSPIAQSKDENFQIFQFSKDQVSKAGVVAAFGEFQSFDFSLRYYLENNEPSKIKTEIAVPPDTSFQKIYFQDFSPEPENIEVDQNGNWLAQYVLNPFQKLEVNVKGQAKVFAKPYQKFKKPESLEPFLGSTDYWPVDDPLIKEAAKNLETTREVYDFVVKTLDYDYSRVREGAERMGAREALLQPDRATCMEFTDLFIALARAVGIPAREANGFAFTTNPQLRPLSLVQDVLHAWPEYWNEESGTWIQIDPTWQKTTGGVDYFNKLDLGHVTFAIHGEDSNYPPPAGAYKRQGTYSKDVVVTFGQQPTPEENIIEAKFEFPKTIASEIKSSGYLYVANLSNPAIYGLKLETTTKGVNLYLKNGQEIDVLPPFSHKRIPLELESLGLFKTGPGEIVVKVNNQEFKQVIVIESFLLKGLIIFVAILGIGLLIFYLFRRIRKRKLTVSDRSDNI